MRIYRFSIASLVLAVFLLGGCQLQLRDLDHLASSPPALIPDTGAGEPLSAPAPALLAPAAQVPLGLPAPDQAAGTLETSAPAQAATGLALPSGTAPSLPASATQEVTRAGVSIAPEPSPTATALPTPLVRLPAEQWKAWPALPQVPGGVRAVYQRGLAQGNNPRAFSILGDCQSQPEEFMGVYDRDPALVRALPAPLQETAAHFAGSFYRYSPTVKDGTTEGALLWVQWNDNKEKKCQFGETPLDCELRVHRPSIVFIHVGTHWESRNRQYLEKILDKLLEHGAAPIIVTKADNREKDERVNQNLASLAEARGLPMWNFWSMVQHLPDNGLKRGSDMYLSDEAIPIHRLGGLQALDAVWRVVR